MPCSASTAAGEACSAPPVSAANNASAPSSLAGNSDRVIALTESLVQPLVIQCTLERRQLLAELLGVGCAGTRIKGFAVTPSLDQSEMIGVAVPLQHVVLQIAVTLAGGVGLRLDELGCLIFSGREDIDMSDHVERPGGNLTFWRGDVETAMRPRSEPVDHRG